MADDSTELESELLGSSSVYAHLINTIGPYFRLEFSQ